ncbi:hypothetical protein [Pantoea sp. At-9b]|uniref:hypothetical protein n=1 Tax=Pantoea sp. (strain At-9b) TaxID=592316 RepID=UPI0001B3E1F4|nr:hypothetical protein [Pantoea sp. At-9b]ADU71514.1 conserved hypothetical protein [Pantoea sp. At-9b]
MRERGMIFNADMVRAVLNGSKTQTRRIMKVQPESNQFGLSRVRASTKRSDIGKYYWSESNATGHHIRSEMFSCPFGAVGDRLWVRETWWQAGYGYARYPDDDEYAWTGSRRILFAADGNPPNEPNPDYPKGLGGGKFSAASPNRLWRKRPSLHMPRWASRITLEITGVRVERLQSMSGEDARSEGFAYEDSHLLGDIDEFSRVWTSIYGEESWQANPWVWVIEFKRVEGGSHD